jgi:hypothetical protein
MKKVACEAALSVLAYATSSAPVNLAGTEEPSTGLA